MATVALRHDGQKLYAEDVTANNTVAATDSGVVLNIRADSLTTTLPATVLGLTVIVRLDGVQVTSGPTGAITGNGKIGHAISPNASDKIIGFGQAGTDDKDMLMAKASHVVGDYVVLVGDGSLGWYVQEASGSWTFES